MSVNWVEIGTLSQLPERTTRYDRLDIALQILKKLGKQTRIALENVALKEKLDEEEQSLGYKVELINLPAKKGRVQSLLKKLLGEKMSRREIRKAFREERLPPGVPRISTLSEEKLAEVIQYIERNDWSNVRAPSRWKKRETTLPVGFIFIKEGFFSININAPLGAGVYKKAKRNILYDSANKTGTLVCNSCFHYRGESEILARELACHKALPRSFVPRFCMVDDDQKLSIISELYQSDGEDLIDNEFNLDGILLSKQERIEILRQVARDLQFLHRAGFIVVDLACSNFLVKWTNKIERYLEAHLNDFGLAFSLKDAQQLYDKHYGHPCVWPPEMVQHHLFDPCNPDLIPMNIWTFGILLYEFLELPFELPFNGDDEISNLISNKISSADERKREIHDQYRERISHDLTDPLQVLVVQMLNFEPKQRPSLEEVISALTAACATPQPSESDSSAES